MNPELSIPGDEVLVLDIINGKEAALALLIKKYWKDIYYVSLTYLNRAEHAEEATQDVFTKIWLMRDRLSDVTNFKNYLFTVTRNHVISELRKSLNKEPVDFDLLRAEQSSNNDQSPEQKLEYKEYRELIEKAISLLPEKRRMIFRLSRFEGLSYSEIGEQLNIKSSTINDHITQANNFIKTYLRANLPGIIISWVVIAGNML